MTAWEIAVIILGNLLVFPVLMRLDNMFYHRRKKRATKGA